MLLPFVVVSTLVEVETTVVTMLLSVVVETCGGLVGLEEEATVDWCDSVVSVAAEIVVVEAGSSQLQHLAITIYLLIVNRPYSLNCCLNSWKRYSRGFLLFCVADS